MTQAMNQFITTPNSTLTLASTRSTQFGNAHNHTEIVLFDIYDYSTNYHVETFIDAADENKIEILRITPFRIIDENKVISCCLARAFQNDL